MKNRINQFLILVLVVMTMFVLITSKSIALSQGNVMLEVYSRYDFDVLQINTKSNGILRDKKMDLEQLLEVKEEIFNILDLKDPEEKIIQEVGLTKCMYNVSSQDADTEIILTSTNNDGKDRTTLDVNICLYGKEDSILYVQSKIEEIYNNFNIKPDVNITMVGTYDGEIDKQECKNIIRRIMASIKGKMYEEYDTEKLSSAYGYTNLIDEYEMLDSEKVNIHVALRYNEYEDKTYLYMATPIIEVDY